MQPEQQQQKSETRGVFRALAGGLAVLFLLGSGWAVNLALGSNGSVDLWRWIVSASLFAFLGVGFAYASVTGRWIRK